MDDTLDLPTIYNKEIKAVMYIDGIILHGYFIIVLSITVQLIDPKKVRGYMWSQSLCIVACASFLASLSLAILLHTQSLSNCAHFQRATAYIRSGQHCLCA
jgi:hypothetical protein